MLIVSGTTLNADPLRAATGNILPYPIYQHKMANGLNVITVPFDSPGLAAFYIVTRVGARNEVKPVEPEQTETRYVHLQNGSIPSYFSMSYKGPAFSNSKIDMPALDVLASIVFSSTSDLYKKTGPRRTKSSLN